MTAPNGPAQQEVIRTAFAWQALEPSEVDGLSMHGTGNGSRDLHEKAILSGVGVCLGVVGRQNW